MARRESKRVMVLRGRRARKARNAFTLCVLLPARCTPYLQLYLPWVQLQISVLYTCHCLMLHAVSHARHRQHDETVQSMPDHILKARRKTVH